MTTQASAAINLGDEGSKGPSIEESLAALKAEGLVSDDDTNTALVDGDGAQGGATDAGEGSNEERPSWLPAKFKTVEDFRKSYEELERKQSAGDTEAETAGDDTAPTAAERTQAEEATEKAGLKLDALQAEFDTDGELSDASYTALEAAGYPREMVDIYVEGLVSRKGGLQDAAWGAAGGAEEYQDMINWAATNLTPKQIADYDAEVNSGNKARVARAAKALKADWDKATAADRSEEPETVITGGKTTVNVYHSQDEYMLDLENPLYEKSSAFRAQVMAKLAKSNI